LQLSTEEPTPEEIGSHLKRLGIDPRAIGMATDFLNSCDAARFAPQPDGGRIPLAKELENVLLQMEANGKT